MPCSEVRNRRQGIRRIFNSLGKRGWMRGLQVWRGRVWGRGEMWKQQAQWTQWWHEGQKETEAKVVTQCFSLAGQVADNSSVCRNLVPSAMISRSRAFGRWSCHESRVLMSGTSGLTKDLPDGSLAPFTRGNAARRKPLWTRNQALTWHSICWCLDLRLLQLPKRER